MGSPLGRAGAMSFYSLLGVSREIRQRDGRGSQANTLSTPFWEFHPLVHPLPVEVAVAIVFLLPFGSFPVA